MITENTIASLPLPEPRSVAEHIVYDHPLETLAVIALVAAALRKLLPNKRA